MLDFKEVKSAALSACPGLLHNWFPLGRVDGKEFCIGSLEGEKGQSLRFNFQKGTGIP